MSLFYLCWNLTDSYVAEIRLFEEFSALAVGIVTVLVVVVIPVRGLAGAVKEPLPVENVVAAVIWRVCSWRPSPHGERVRWALSISEERFKD